MWPVTVDISQSDSPYCNCTYRAWSTRPAGRAESSAAHVARAEEDVADEPAQVRHRRSRPEVAVAEAVGLAHRRRSERPVGRDAGRGCAGPFLKHGRFVVRSNVVQNASNLSKIVQSENSLRYPLSKLPMRALMRELPTRPLYELFTRASSGRSTSYIYMGL